MKKVLCIFLALLLMGCGATQPQSSLSSVSEQSESDAASTSSQIVSSQTSSDISEETTQTTNPIEAPIHKELTTAILPWNDVEEQIPAKVFKDTLFATQAQCEQVAQSLKQFNINEMDILLVGEAYRKYRTDLNKEHAAKILSLLQNLDFKAMEPTEKNPAMGGGMVYYLKQGERVLVVSIASFFTVYDSSIGQNLYFEYTNNSSVLNYISGFNSFSSYSNVRAMKMNRKDLLNIAPFDGAVYGTATDLERYKKQISTMLATDITKVYGSDNIYDGEPFPLKIYQVSEIVPFLQNTNYLTLISPNENPATGGGWFAYLEWNGKPINIVYDGFWLTVKLPGWSNHVIFGLDSANISKMGIYNNLNNIWAINNEEPLYIDNKQVTAIYSVNAANGVTEEMKLTSNQFSELLAYSNSYPQEATTPSQYSILFFTGFTKQYIYLGEHANAEIKKAVSQITEGHPSWFTHMSTNRIVSISASGLDHTGQKNVGVYTEDADQIAIISEYLKNIYTKGPAKVFENPNNPSMVAGLVDIRITFDNNVQYICYAYSGFDDKNFESQISIYATDLNRTMSYSVNSKVVDNFRRLLENMSA